MSKKSYFQKIIFKIVAAIIALVLIGCVFVFSASSFSAEQTFGNKFYFLSKQIVGVLIGLAAMIGISFVPYQIYKKLKWWAVGIAVLLLCLVFVPGIGIENYGARRWIGLGPLSMQPSEIAKFALVIFCASHFSIEKEKPNSFKNMLMPLLVGGIFCGLIIIEPNMSITICVGITLVAMLVLGGMKWKHFSIISLAAATFVPLLVIMEPYRIKRLVAFIDPWQNPKGEGFQLIQSLYAIGGGGFFGLGLFCSRQKNLFLPFAESDFIFSIIVEETGFLGGFCLLCIFACLVLNIARIAFNAKDRFGMLLCSGIAVLILSQVVINVCVVSGMIPPTGLPLPFISAGSTSIITNMAAIGICWNVAKQSSAETILAA